MSVRSTLPTCRITRCRSLAYSAAQAAEAFTPDCEIAAGRLPACQRSETWRRGQKEPGADGGVPQSAIWLPACHLPGYSGSCIPSDVGEPGGVSPRGAGDRATNGQGATAPSVRNGVRWPGWSFSGLGKAKPGPERDYSVPSGGLSPFGHRFSSGGFRRSSSRFSICSSFRRTSSILASTVALGFSFSLWAQRTMSNDGLVL